MSRVLLIIIFIIAGVGVFMGLGSKYFQKPQLQKYTGPVLKMTIGAPKFAPEYQALFLIAQEQGYFREYGLDILIEPLETSVQVDSAVSEKKVDIGLTTDFTFAVDSFDSDNLQIVASVDKVNIATIIGRADRGIREPKDLKGKKIGIAPKTAAEFFLDRFLIENNISQQDVEIVPIAASMIRQAFVEGQVDSIVFTKKVALELKRELKEKVVYWSVQGDQPIYVLLITHKDALPARKELMERLLNALIEAEIYLQTNQTGALETIGKHLPPADKEYFLSDIESFQFEVSLDQGMILLMEDQARFVIQNKLTDKTKVPNYLDYIYFDALTKVKPEAVTIIH